MTRLVLALALSPAVPLAAQATASPAPVFRSDRSSVATWPSALPSGKKVWVVTDQRTGVRQSCKAPALNEANLTCKRHFGRQTIFARTEIAAILKPASSENAAFFGCAAVFLGVGGGTIYGGVLLLSVALPAAIPIIALGSFVALAAGACGFAADAATSETLLYQQPGIPLSVTVGH